MDRWPYFFLAAIFTLGPFTEHAHLGVGSQSANVALYVKEM